MPEVECGFPALTDGGAERLIEFGPTLLVKIGLDLDRKSGGGVNLPLDPHLALIDTGASHSCIDSGVADALGLPMVDRITLSGVHGSGEANVYLAQIEASDIDFVLFGRFAGVHLQAGGQPHAALLGRDFLGLGFVMVYDGAAASVKLRR